MKTKPKLLSLPIVFILMAMASLQAADGVAYESLFEKELILFLKADDLAAVSQKMKLTPWHKFFQDKEVIDFLEKPAAELQKRIEILNATVTEKLGAEFNLEDLPDFIPQSYAFVIENPRKGVFNSGKDFSCVLIAQMNESDEKGEHLLALIDAFIKSEEGTLSRRGREIEGVNVVGVFLFDGTEKSNLLTYAVVDNYFIVGKKLGGVKRLITALKQGREEHFGQSEKYQQLLTLAGEQVDGISYIDLENIIAALPQAEMPANLNPDTGNNMMMPPPPPDPARVIEALGLANLKFLGGWNYLNGKGENLSYAYLHTPGERSGLIKLLASGEAPMLVPDYLSSSSFLHEAFRLSLKRTCDLMLEVAEKLQPGSSMMITMGLAAAQGQIGVNIPEQILEPLGDEISFGFILPEDMGVEIEGMPPPMSMTETPNMMLLSVEVKDVPVLEASLATIAAKYIAEGAILEEIEEYNNYTIHAFALGGNEPMLGLPVPCYVIANDRLFFALAVDTLKTVIDNIQREDGGLKDIPMCRLAQERLDEAAIKYPGPDKAIALLCMNEGPYFGWYSTQIKLSFSLLVNFYQTRQARQEEALNQMDADEDGEAPQLQQGMDNKFWVTLGEFIDFDYWPGWEVFERYLGFSMARVRFVEDGIFMEYVNVPNPNPPKVQTEIKEVF